MIRSRLLSPAALACALFLLVTPATMAGQRRAPDSPRSASTAFAPLAQLQQFFGSLLKCAVAALGSPATAVEEAPSVITGDEGSSLDPHG